MKNLKARVTYSTPGHDNEIIVGFDNYDHNKFIPEWIEAQLLDHLHKQGLAVIQQEIMNRGTRLEIMTIEWNDDSILMVWEECIEFCKNLGYEVENP